QEKEKLPPPVEEALEGLDRGGSQHQQGPAPKEASPAHQPWLTRAEVAPRLVALLRKSSKDHATHAAALKILGEWLEAGYDVTVPLESLADVAAVDSDAGCRASAVVALRTELRSGATLSPELDAKVQLVL